MSNDDKKSRSIVDEDSSEYPASANPYQSPNSANSRSPKQWAEPTLEYHWRVVQVIACIYLVIAAVELGVFVRSAALLVSAPQIGGLPGFSLAALAICILTVTSAVGTLCRKRWAVRLLAVMSFIPCAWLVMFTAGASFMACMDKEHAS